MAKAIKTIKLKIVNPNKGKEDALESTLELFNSVLSTYLDLTLQHENLLKVPHETVKSITGEVHLRRLHNSEILTELEFLSLPTPYHPMPAIQIKSLFPSLPTPIRRSCINTSTGMCKSYLSNKKNWESHRKGDPPKPPKAKNLPTFYKGTYQLELLDIKNPCFAVRLKVFDGTNWVWKNYPVKIGTHQLRQLNDPSWSMQSPTLIPKRTKRGKEWFLHIPLVKKVDVSPIQEQKKENPSLTTLAVDLGLRHLAVVTVRKEGKIVCVKFFKGSEVEAHRLQHLFKVFKKQKKSGKPVKGERSNKELWRHLRSTNTDVAHNITREIVSIALCYEVQVIIIEHLKKFQPRKGEKRSRKLSRKLTYWLKGKIEEQLRYKAFFHGILVKSVSPYYTSQMCHRCGFMGERFSRKSLFRCNGCKYEANADFNASVNLHKVFWGIFSYPKVSTRSTRRKQKQKLKASRPLRFGRWRIWLDVRCVKGHLWFACN